MSFYSNLGEINLGEFNLGDLGIVSLVELTSDVSDDSNNLNDDIDVDLVGSLSVDSSDDLNNWSDTVNVEYAIQYVFADTLTFSDEVIADIPEKYIDVSDSFTLSDAALAEFFEKYLTTDDTLVFSDEIRVDFPEKYFSYSDTLSLTDSVYVHLLIYLHPLNITVSDTMIYPLNEAVEVLNGPLVNLTVTSSDDLSSWNDEVIRMPGAEVAVAYDAMTSYWSDAVSNRLYSFVTRSDQFTLYDYVKISLTCALACVDTLAMSDGVTVQLSVKDTSLSDSADLWADLVKAELKGSLVATLADSMTQTDGVSTDTALGEDINYYRRYLNDVIS